MEGDDKLPPLEDSLGVSRENIAEAEAHELKCLSDAGVDFAGNGGEVEDGNVHVKHEGRVFKPLPAVEELADPGYNAEKSSAHEEVAEPCHHHSPARAAASSENQDSAEGLPAPPCLCKLTFTERCKFYKSWFQGTTHSLSQIDSPKQCDTFPAFANEIREAYLSHTTFTVTVWTNYDAMAGKFFTASDPRYVDCGGLVMSPAAVDRLQRIDPELDGGIRRVIFEVGTAFNTLCKVIIRLKPASHDGYPPTIHLSLTDLDCNWHPDLTNFLDSVCRGIAHLPVWPNIRGFTILNLTWLANKFRNEQTEGERWEHFYWPNSSAWMELERDGEPNYGYVELNSVDGTPG